MLDDKYRIERLLATGGMGAVYLGTHVGLRKRVAIKIVNPLLNSAMIERFHREAVTASKIGHEGIAQVTDIGTSSDGEPFLVMEYLEGEPLAARLKAVGRFAIDDACELGCAILSPLAAAHKEGIVHRDLKPDNVFLVRQSRGEVVKLLDFGISHTADRETNFRLTTTGVVLGTPYYMSPEQARGESEVTPAADLYAFGVILYEMLTGEVPIRAENYNALMYRVSIGDYVPPRVLRPEVPEGLEHVIMWAMARTADERPASAAELEQGLLAFCRPAYRERALGRGSSLPPLRMPPVTSLRPTIDTSFQGASTPGEGSGPLGWKAASGPGAIDHDAEPTEIAAAMVPASGPGAILGGAPAGGLAYTSPDVVGPGGVSGASPDDGLAYTSPDVVGPGGVSGASLPASGPGAILGSGPRGVLDSGPGSAVGSRAGSVLLSDTTPDVGGPGGERGSQPAMIWAPVHLPHPLDAASALTGPRRRSPAARIAIGAALVAGAALIAAVLVTALTGPDPAPTTAAAPAVPAPSFAPAAAAAPAPAAAAPPEAPGGEPRPTGEAATIVVKLAIDPPVATVTLDGKPVAGGELTAPRDGELHHLRITAAGYVGYDEPIRFDVSQRVVVALKRAAVAPPPRARPRRDPLDGIESQSPYH